MKQLTKQAEELIREVIGIEGGYSDDPKDSGGRTNLGITWLLAEKYGYDVETLTISQAMDIYNREFIENLSINKVLPLSYYIAKELFDTGVNMHWIHAAEFLQRSLNVLNKNAQLFDDLLVDGMIGPATIAALRAYMNHRGVAGERVLLNMLNSLQGAAYIGLSERRPKDERFTYGWFLNRVQIA